MERVFNILLVENASEDAARIEKKLRQCEVSFHLKRVESFKEFLLAFEMFQPDLVLAEYSLPEFNAIEALNHVKRARWDVPILLITGRHSEEAVVECMRQGAQDYILKDSLVRLPPAVTNTLAKREAQRERATAEAQYRLITESTRDLISLLDRNFHVLYASPSFKRVLDHDPKALEHIPFMSMVHPDDLPPFEKSLEEALFFREGRNVELRICHANGTWQYFEATASYIFDESGKPVRALVVSRDASDRKRAEKEIRKLAAFPRFNPNPVLEFAEDGSLTYFNDAAMRMARSLRRPHPQMILPLNTATIVKRCLSTGKNRLHVETGVAGRCLTWSFFPIIGNQVVHCYAEDVTDGRNLEAQLRQAQKMDSIGQLAAGVAHDFNNILTVIQGHSSLMMDHRSLEPLALQSTKQISIAAERAANLTRQLLMFSRKQIMQPQLLDLNEVIANVTKMLRSLLGEQINLRRELTESLPPVHADPGMIEQILVNVVVNARDAMPKGGVVTLRTYYVETDDRYVDLHPLARAGKFICLAVTDNGHGMDEATLTHIFEPFFTTKEIGRGTGLGLATVYGIVKQHEGWIEVESELDQGTTFKTFLPISTKAPRKRDSITPEIVPGGNETILVVEDEASLRDLVQEILEKKGYRVLVATNGVEALEIWARQKDSIDLLLTDMMMPAGLSGRELAEKALTEKSHLKVLYTSGYSIDVVNPGFTSQAGQNFLQKPYHPETLAQAVRDCLNTLAETTASTKDEAPPLPPSESQKPMEPVNKS
jgi:PAS domain S-box-containing protein